ncbi:polysaccharide biosynthesis protein [Candidatus Nitrosopumilus salaria BD31]|uniref:Polysaccharide biosynthesis protein n=1 Tax=Candidatus Nitrosopumilus salarius BD31 TaxID=859350 RepID=I3D5D1_9ARCH|nr:oligosaccharide flippase family protein [Candidatus Nitrosopumilus salaria]EIJ66924.1 polysaccharide biosynthesis protein [Candidatus Nitrosopumilus salaria BD31]
MIWDKIKKFSGKKDLASIGIANIVSSGISGLFWIYLAALIGAENYGELSYLLAIVGIVATVASMGSGYTTIVYTAKNINILPATFIITLIGSAIAAVAIYLGLNNPVLSTYVLLYVVFNLGVGVIFGLKQYKKYAFLAILQKVIMVALILSLYQFYENNGIILGYALSFLVFLPTIFNEIKTKGVQFSVIRPRLGFMINSYGIDLVKVFSANTDKIIIGPLLGLSILGNYYLGIQFLAIATLIPNIVMQYTLPRDSSGQSNENLKKITVVFSVLVAIIGIIAGPSLIKWAFPQFVEAITIIQIIIVIVIPKTISQNLISKFLGFEKSRFVIIGSVIFLAVQIPSIFLLSETLGIIGIAISLVLAETIQAVFYIISNKLFLARMK